MFDINKEFEQLVDCKGKFYSENDKSCKICTDAKECMIETYKHLGKELPGGIVNFDEVLNYIITKSPKKYLLSEKAGYTVLTAPDEDIWLSGGSRETGVFLKDIAGEWKNNINAVLKAGYYRITVSHNNVGQFQYLKDILKKYWRIA